MARVNLPVSAFVPNGVLDDPSGTAGDDTDGHVIQPSADWPAGTSEEIVLRVVNGTTAVEVTVLAGTNPPALEAGLGDLVETVDADSTAFIGPFTSQRFLSQASGDDPEGIWVDLDDASNVTLTAFHMPRSA